MIFVCKIDSLKIHFSSQILPFSFRFLGPFADEIRNNSFSNTL